MSSNVIGTILVKVNSGIQLNLGEIKLYNDYMKNKLENSIFQNQPIKGQEQSGGTSGTSGNNSTSAAGNNGQTAGNDPQAPAAPKTTAYVVQVGDKISDLVKKSLRAQGKSNYTNEEYNAAKEKFLQDNKDNIKKAKNGTQYLNAGAEVVLDGEIDVANNKAKEAVEAAYREKYGTANDVAAKAKAEAEAKAKADADAAKAAAKKVGDKKGEKPENKTEYSINKTNGQVTRTYEKGKLIQETINNHDGNLIVRIYDENGSAVEKKVPFKDDKYNPTTKTGDQYNRNGNNINVKTYLNGKQTGEKVHIYDQGLEKEANNINSINDNKSKIIAWNKAKDTQSNYVIVDKKSCTASVYSPDGKVIKTFEVGVGKDIGDNFNDANGISGKKRKSTPAGEYTIAINHSEQEDYGKLSFSLGTKGNLSKSDPDYLAMHQVPNSLKKERVDLFGDNNSSNNRMSYGCVNFLQEDFSEVATYVGEGSKIYILPEESDNKLVLNKNEQGEYEFSQTKYNKHIA